MSIFIGEVTSVSGMQIILTVDETSNKDTIFFEGKRYKGISMREHVSIQRGFRDIICIVEGEYLDERRFQDNPDKIEYIRKVNARPLGYIENNQFFQGIKYLPLIKDPSFLLPEEVLKKIYASSLGEKFCIGSLLKEGLSISLPWQKIFNTHIGIFGNTGSGKSNTLTKLYTTLFNEKYEQIKGNSQFVLIDFNGEYMKDQMLPKDQKTTIELDTSTQKDQFPLSESEFWNAETLSILFQATSNTQKPFISRVLQGREKYRNIPNSLLNYIKSTIQFCFTSTSQKPETLDLLKRVVRNIDGSSLLNKLDNIIWHSSQNKFKYEPIHNAFFDNQTRYNTYLNTDVSSLTIQNITPFIEFTIRCELQLIRDLMYGFVQFDHIQPLLKRADSSLSGLSKVIKIDTTNQINDDVLTVISLRSCNQDVKKIIPLLITKHYYNSHKKILKRAHQRKPFILSSMKHTISFLSNRRESNQVGKTIDLSYLKS
ncbi:helicase HerA domain-containing protein [Moritella viscosa]|uniref:Helicase HerA central domain-containing protein n=1 Tax=Moritella viscosa TaxID=80854 RepID=A0A1L0CQC9_9GAMM|nr:DUF87 domain-containing protein [Moritella viscosa]SGZ20700.1 Putative uncharacterized protein [Moritella viscosa]